MKKLLITVLAVILSVSMSFAAGSSAKETAREKVKSVLAETKSNKEEALVKLYEQITNGKDAKAKEAIEALKKVFTKEDELMDALALYASAKDISAESKKLSAEVRYVVMLLQTGNLSVEAAAPYLNAAKLLLEEGASAESFTTLTNQIKADTRARHASKLAVKSGKIKEAISDEDAIVTGFMQVSKIDLGGSYTAKEIRERAGKGEEKFVEFLRELEEWKKNCGKGA